MSVSNNIKNMATHFSHCCGTVCDKTQDIQNFVELQRDIVSLHQKQHNLKQEMLGMADMLEAFTRLTPDHNPELTRLKEQAQETLQRLEPAINRERLKQEQEDIKEAGEVQVMGARRGPRPERYQKNREGKEELSL